MLCTLPWRLGTFRALWRRWCGDFGLHLQLGQLLLERLGRHDARSGVRKVTIVRSTIATIAVDGEEACSTSRSMETMTYCCRFIPSDQPMSVIGRNEC
jgi:hypothetical protein